MCIVYIRGLQVPADVNCARMFDELSVMPCSCLTCDRYDDHLVSNPVDVGSLFEYWAQPGMARWAIGMLSEVRTGSHRCIIAVLLLEGSSLHRTTLVPVSQTCSSSW